MEDWQINHIQNNLVQLVKATTCNPTLITSLVTKNVLSSDDMESLERPTLTPLEKSKELYKLLVTRTGSFNILIECLQSTRQSGATKILIGEQSVLRNYGCISFDKNKVLGTGASGKVFQGSFGGRNVAVKVINTDFQEADTALKEIDFLKRLDHHVNVVRYFVAEERDNYIFIALELCLISLEDEVDINLLNINPHSVLRDCAKGLRHLHENNVLHRDLKPANILLTEDKQVKISDFGISKEIPVGKSKLTITSSSVGMGTIGWMAPEVQNHYFDGKKQREKLQMSKASDVFSLGCVFYFVLTKGAHPFGSNVEMLSNICRGELQTQNSNIDADWLSLIEHMISQQPAKRPDAGYVILSLKCFIPKRLSLAADNNNNCVKSVEMERVKGPRALTDDIILSMDCLANAKYVDEEGNTYLHLAIINESSFETMQTYVQSGVDWNKQNFKGETVVHLAVQNENFSALKYFLELGCDVHIKDDLGEMPVHKTKSNTYNFKKTLDTLLEFGADINARKIDGSTPLGLATLEGKTRDKLEYIVGRGGDWNAKKSNGCSMLHLAAGGGNFDAVKYFASMGLDIHFQDIYGEMPIHKIKFAPRKFKKTLDTLLEHGAEINSKSTNGSTPLGLAVQCGRSREELEYIVRKGGDWRMTNNEGESMLHLAAEGGKPGAVKYFVQLGADIHSKDNLGEMPVHKIKFAERNFKDTLDTLLDSGANINSKDNEGRTLLGYAVWVGRSEEELAYIVRRGGDLSARAKDGSSIRDLARKGRNREAVNYVTAHGT